MTATATTASDEPTVLVPVSLLDDMVGKVKAHTEASHKGLHEVGELVLTMFARFLESPTVCSSLLTAPTYRRAAAYARDLARSIREESQRQFPAG